MPVIHSRYLTHRNILIVTLVACLPALFSGYLGDDYIHYALLSSDLSIPKAHDWSLFGLFSWIDADPQRNQVLMDLGVLPWWTYEGMRYQFWRPLTEISHWIDHQLWHGSPMLMHLHSLLLYLALGAVLYRVYHQLKMNKIAALLALAVFMLDSTHGLTVSWIANRNALLAALFGLLSIHHYIQWRETENQQAFWVSLLCLIASLFSGEIGISTACYLGAYALALDKKGPAKSMLALWPFALLCIVWWVFYKMGNFGANHSDVNYIDPLESPLIFLSNIFERIPVLLFSQLGIIPAEIYGFSPQPMPTYIAVCLLFIIGVLYLMWPLLKSSLEARFWALGTLFAVIPITTTIPSDRNLLFVGIGASALMGMLFHTLFSHLEPARMRRIGARLLVGIHLIISPLLLPIFSYSPQLWSNLMGLQMARNIPIDNTTESILTFGIPMPVGMGAGPMRFAEGLTLPDKLWTISTLQQNFIITRINENTLHIHSDQGMVDQLEATLRDLKQFPFPNHFKIGMTDMALEILETNEKGQPTELALTFDNNRLATTHIMTWNGKTFERSAIPAPGETLVLNLSKREPPELVGTTEAY